MVHYNRRFNKLITIFNCKFLKHGSLAYFESNLLPLVFLLQSENGINYHIDTSVLLENIPVVKFTKTTSGTRVVLFSII